MECAEEWRREARVMCFNTDQSDSGVLLGEYDKVPWGMYGDLCFRIELETGQELHVWLEGVTDRKSRAEYGMLQLG